MPEAKARSSPPVYLRYGSALLLVALATVVRILTIHAGPRFTYLPFIIAVIFTCWYGRLGPGLLATVLGVFLGAHYATDLASSRPGGYLIVSLFVVWAMHALQRGRERLEIETAARLRVE